MTNNTEVTRRDLKIYPSERLTDNDEGGGFPTYIPLTGADNEIFTPVSPIDRANGSFSVRLCYAAVNCTDDSRLYGSYFAITKPPKDDAVSYFAMDAKRFAESRKDCVNRIERCRIYEGEIFAPLINPARGSDTLNLRSLEGDSARFDVGETLYIEARYNLLIQDSGVKKSVIYGEFIRVETKQEYSYDANAIAGTSKTGSNITTTKGLKNSYSKSDVLSRGYLNIEGGSFVCSVRRTKVVDDYRLYGVKKLEATVAKDTQSIKIGGLTDKIAPFINGEIVETQGIDVMTLTNSADTEIFKKGDTILISSTLSFDLGSSHSAGQTVQLPRDKLSRVCLTDALKKPIDANLWDYDLALGTIKWKSPLDTSSYIMPITANHAQEELNSIDAATDDGVLSLRFKTIYDYDAADTYISSVINKGGLQVRHSIPFTQRNWINKWENIPQSEQLLNKLNLTVYPMVLTDDGAITERWVIKFVSNTLFELYGERFGYVGKFDTLTDLKPKNPFSTKSFFKIPKEAFGNDAPWASQDVIRFNTYGTLFGVQILRVVHPNRNTQVDSDGFKMCLFGATTEI